MTDYYTTPPGFGERYPLRKEVSIQGENSGAGVRSIRVKKGAVSGFTPRDVLYH